MNPKFDVIEDWPKQYIVAAAFSKSSPIKRRLSRANKS